MAGFRFKGIQKTTLVDYPGEVACTLFTGGCNFRCGYCFNPALALDEATGVEIEPAAALEFLEERHGFLDAVVISGGEPLMWPEIEGFIRQVKELGYKIKLDTNGSYPERLKKLLDHGLLDYVAMDIKAPRHKYPQVAGVPMFDEKVEQSRALLMASKVEHEFRTTVFSHLDDSDFERIGEWLNGASRYFLQLGKNAQPILDETFNNRHQRVTRESLEPVRRRLKHYISEVSVR